MNCQDKDRAGIGARVLRRFRSTLAMVATTCCPPRVVVTSACKIRRILCLVATSTGTRRDTSGLRRRRRSIWRRRWWRKHPIHSRRSGSICASNVHQWQRSVVGAQDGAGGTSRPIFWQNGQLTILQGLNGSLEDANSINDSGQIVGNTVANASTSRAVLWANHNSAPTVLPEPQGVIDDEGYVANGINNAGDIVGNGSTSNPPFGGHTIVWPHGMATAVILPGLPGSINSSIWSINTPGQAVGTSLLASFDAKQVLFNLAQPNSPQDLGIPVTAASTTHVPSVNFPVSINVSGVIAGTLKEPTIGQTVAYVRKPGGQITQIPGPNGLADQTEALGINSGGTLVITVNPDNLGSTPNAAVYDSANGLRNLNTLIPSGSGWQLLYATAINDAGQIVGSGIFHGTSHGYLLNPKK